MNSAAMSLLLSEQQKAQKPKPKQGMSGEDLLRLLGNAAPVAGGVIGGIAGGPAGAAVGSGLGGLAGMGAGVAADGMQRDREGREIDEEEEAMRDLARKRALASFL